MEKILVVSIHPDDETLGVGGMILKHKHAGDEIYWLNLTDGNAIQETKIDVISEMYGFNKTYRLGFPEIMLDALPVADLVGSIGQVIKEIEPSMLYIPNRSDVHTDHQVGFKAVYSCTKNFRYPSIEKIRMYETLSETEFAPALPEYVFIPNGFADITDFFDRKVEIMKVYDSEIMEGPYPRSLEAIEALARYRGSRIGEKYAEAFVSILEIW